MCGVRRDQVMTDENQITFNSAGNGIEPSSVASSQSAPVSSVVIDQSSVAASQSCETHNAGSIRRKETRPRRSKGLGGLQQEKTGIWTVRVLVTRAEYDSMQSAQFVDEAFSGSLPAFLAAFTSGKPLTEEQQQQAQQIEEEAIQYKHSKADSLLRKEIEAKQKRYKEKKKAKGKG